MDVGRREAACLILVGKIGRHAGDIVTADHGRRVDDLLEHRAGRRRTRGRKRRRGGNGGDRGGGEESGKGKTHGGYLLFRGEQAFGG